MVESLETVLSTVAEPLAAVERALARAFDDAEPLAAEIAQHLLQSGGKRVRPLMVLLFAHLFTDEVDRAVPIAAAAEMIHMATLVHDDVIDEAKTRRGRPTAGHAWGSQAAVLTGDMLLARALITLVDHSEARVVRLMSDMIFRMCEGEIAQNRGLFDLDQTEATYLARIRKKTADFFAACCEAGALAGGAQAEAAQCAAEFGLHMGIAFQIIDDLLDVEGDAAVVGKPVGNDLRSGVLTLPVLRAFADHKEAARARSWLSQRSLTPEQVDQLLVWVRETDGCEYARTQALAHAEQATAALGRLPSGPIRDLLGDLSGVLLTRAR
ncbi:MAG TPA: polyprenyl synthetase family protein [Limnochordia bacterium]|nr:polyprenyl synthetase family protein [Limnochordia bacterium]